MNPFEPPSEVASNETEPQKAKSSQPIVLWGCWLVVLFGFAVGILFEFKELDEQKQKRHRIMEEQNAARLESQRVKEAASKAERQPEP